MKIGNYTKFGLILVAVATSFVIGIKIGSHKTKKINENEPKKATHSLPIDKPEPPLKINFNKNMKYAINLNPVLPIRAEGKESAELTTQLLFGDYCEVVEDDQKSFVKIKNHADGYEGWADKKMLTKIDKAEFEALASEPIYRTIAPLSEVFDMTNKTMVRLTAGSLLPHYNKETNTCKIADRQFQIHPDFITYLPGENKEGIIPTALMFLNTPYMWGGKSILGIDCSGFTQTVFSMNGITLERDASQQAKEGIEVSSLKDAQPNDLLFFEKHGKIIHVGIYLGNNRVIHSSGHVRIDSIDEKGIWMPEREYTHHLAKIRRIN